MRGKRKKNVFAGCYTDFNIIKTKLVLWHFEGKTFFFRFMREKCFHIVLIRQQIEKIVIDY